MKKHIRWPPKLLQIAVDHIHCVENPLGPSIPPLLPSVSIFSFFEQYTSLIARDLSRMGKVEDEKMIDCCVQFVLELLEQSCAHGFLKTKERRAVTTAAKQLEKQLTSYTSKSMPTSAPLKKKRREETGSSFGGEAVNLKFSRVLPLEYLLRLIVSLPSILEQYDRLSGSALPEYSKNPFWFFINHTLQLMDAHPEYFTAMQFYIPLQK